MDHNGPVTARWIEVISSAASDKWLEFGRVLLRKTTKDITNIAATLANPNCLCPKDKLVKILEKWLSNSAVPGDERDMRSKLATRKDLRKACQDEQILGGVDRLLLRKYKKDPHHEWQDVSLRHNDDLLEAVAEMGSNKWRSFGFRLLGCTAVELDNVCGEAGVSNSDRVHAIIDQWLREYEGEATVDKLLEVCSKVGIRGRVELNLQDLQQQNQQREDDGGEDTDEHMNVQRDSSLQECDMN